MLLGKLSANWKLAATSNKVLLFTNALLSIAVVIAVGAATANKERVTIAPPTIDKPLTIGWSSATTDYYKSMALYFSGVMGMAGPRNLEYVIGVVERFSAPEVAEGIKAKLRMQASSYEFRNSTSTSWFEGKEVDWEEQTRKVFVVGYLKLMGANRQEITQNVVYEYIVSIVEGRPVIAHFDSYSGDQPHTLSWFSDKRRAESDQKRRDDAMKEMLESNGFAQTNGPAVAQPKP